MKTRSHYERGITVSGKLSEADMAESMQVEEETWQDTLLRYLSKKGRQSYFSDFNYHTSQSVDYVTNNVGWDSLKRQYSDDKRNLYQSVFASTKLPHSLV